LLQFANQRVAKKFCAKDHLPFGTCLWSTRSVRVMTNFKIVALQVDTWGVLSLAQMTSYYIQYKYDEYQKLNIVSSW
jgi:hypothetical protein